MKLFERVPHIRWKPPAPLERIVSAQALDEYPSLRADLDTADAVLLGPFQQANLAALEAQNRHRFDQLLLIGGAALATLAGAIGAAAETARWPGLVEAVLAGGTTALALRGREAHDHDEYLSQRLRAERLRSEYFQFVTRSGPYAGDAQPVLRLRQRTAAISHGREPS